MSKIIILNGSPRLHGNTAGLIDTFKQNAEKRGHEITLFNLQKMNIHPCLGCFGGGKNPNKPCIQEDDMQQIYPAYEEADIVVLASPMYYWSIMLMAAEGNNKNNFEPIEHYYHSLLEHLGWKNLGEIYAGGVMGIGDIKGHPALEDVKKLALSI